MELHSEDWSFVVDHRSSVSVFLHNVGCFSNLCALLLYVERSLALKALEAPQLSHPIYEVGCRPRNLDREFRRAKF